MMRSKGYDWRTSPEWFRYGVILKRKAVMKKTLNPWKNEQMEVERTEIAVAPASVLKKQFSQRHISFLMTKVLTKENFPEFYDLFETIPSGEVAENNT